MSRTRNNDRTVSPVKKYIKFAGDKGLFQFYDKELGNVELEYPVKFMVLDQLMSVGGYNAGKGAYFYSNEIHNLGTEPLKVRYRGSNTGERGGVFAEGLWEHIKEKIKSSGGKYCRVIYAMMNDEIVKLELTGAAVSKWFEIDFDLMNNAVQIKEVGKGKKGAINYCYPVFEPLTVSEELKKKADELDIELQKYLDVYKVAQQKPIEEESYRDTGVPPEEDMPEDDTSY